MTARARIARLRADRSGVSAVEFAMVLPFLVTLFIGSYQVCDAVSAYRKVTATTRAVADLTSQYTTVTTSDVDTVLAASQQMLTPYKLNDAKIIVSQIKIDGNGVATVDWSQGKNVSGLTPGSAFTLPNQVKTNNTYLVVASVDFTYKPIASSSIVGTIPMRDQIILSPRASASITYRTS